MKSKNLITSLALLILTSSLFAQHENCDHGDAPDASLQNGLSNLVQVDKMSLESINLKTAKAEKKAIENLVMAVGKIENIPSRTAVVASRISGRVTELYVSPDTSVKKGDPICKIESFLAGNPPPSILLKAPDDGIVESLNIVRGSPVEPNVEIARIADITKLYAVANVFESNIGKLKIGLPARIKLEAFDGKTFSARLVKFGSKLSESGNTLPVYFEIDNPLSEIKSGMRGIFYIVTNSNKPSVIVPKSSIIGDTARKFVFVEKCPEDKIYEKRQVIIGKTDDRNVEILHGIKAGETVASGGAYQLQFMPPADITGHGTLLADNMGTERNSAKATKISVDTAHDHSQHAKMENPALHDESEHDLHEHNEYEHAAFNGNSIKNSVNSTDSIKSDILKNDIFNRLKSSEYFGYMIYALLAASIFLNIVFAAAFIRNAKK